MKDLRCVAMQLRVTRAKQQGKVLNIAPETACTGDAYLHRKEGSHDGRMVAETLIATPSMLGNQRTNVQVCRRA